MASLSPRLLACTALLGLALSGSHAFAQSEGNPPGSPSQPGVNPICPRLEAQLATIERGGSGDPARDDQIRRYQDAAAKQQSELERVTLQGKRMGCESSGFFSIFSGRSAECGPVNSQIQQMRANLDQINISLERLRGGGFGGSDRENQRRSVLSALGQNSCGPQYQQYANAGRNPSSAGNFLTSLFGGADPNNSNPAASLPPPSADLAPPSGTYRTVCVRTCDGAYFPISFATVPGRFADDERACKAQCPAAEANLYTYRNPGEDMNQAVSVNGQPYTALPNAFHYRTEFNPTCSCKAPGQTWAEALKSIDDKTEAAQQGDIIVTEESAKRMQQRQTGRTPAPKKGATATPDASAPSTPAPDASAGASGNNKQIRTVGPTFIPSTR
jgi:Protein of unknown function (DUF2865)